MPASDSKNRLDVVYSSSNTFSLLTGVSIESLLFNNHREFDVITLHILDNGISAQNVNILEQIANAYSTEIKFYRGLKEKLSAYNLPAGRWTIATWLRVLIPELLGEDIEECLYLDGDTVVDKSLKELMQTNMKDAMIAGVVAINVSNEFKSRLGISPEKKYICAGVLLMNLDEMRKNNFAQGVLEYTKNNIDKIIAADQDAINGYIRNIVILPPKYDNLCYGEMNTKNQRHVFPDTFSIYSDAELNEARTEAVIYHYGGTAYYDGQFFFKTRARKRFVFYKSRTPYAKEKTYILPPCKIIRVIGGAVFYNAPVWLAKILVRFMTN